jgi:hypothetical protein
VALDRHLVRLEGHRAQGRPVISAASRGSMNLSMTSSRSGQSRSAASAYRESVASTAGPLASSSSAAFELARPVR